MPHDDTMSFRGDIPVRPRNAAAVRFIDQWLLENERDEAGQWACPMEGHCRNWRDARDEALAECTDLWELGEMIETYWDQCSANLEQCHTQRVRLRAEWDKARDSSWFWQQRCMLRRKERDDARNWAGIQLRRADKAERERDAWHGYAMEVLGIAMDNGNELDKERQGHAAIPPDLAIREFPW